MPQLPMDDEKLKGLLKTALVEVLEERRDILRDLIEETLEDMAMARAIEQGRLSEDVKRSEILSIIEGGH